MDEKQHDNDLARTHDVVTGDTRRFAVETPEHKASTAQRAELTVKNGISNSLRSIDQIEAETVNLVRNTVSNTIRATGAVAEGVIHVTRDVVKGAIAATEEVGTGLVMSTKDVAKGIILGVNDVGATSSPRRAKSPVPL